MRKTDKSLQSEKFKQVVGGLGKPLGKSPAPDRTQSPRDLDRSFPCWPGSGYFGTAPGSVLSTAEEPRPFQLGTSDRHRRLGADDDLAFTILNLLGLQEYIATNQMRRWGGLPESRCNKPPISTPALSVLGSPDTACRGEPRARRRGALQGPCARVRALAPGQRVLWLASAWLL